MHSFRIDSCLNFNFDLSQFFFTFTLHCKQSEVGNWSFGDTSRWVEGKSTLNACCYVIMLLKSNCWNNEFIIKQNAMTGLAIRWNISQKALKILIILTNLDVKALREISQNKNFPRLSLSDTHRLFRVYFWPQISIQHFYWMNSVHICRSLTKIDAFAHHFSESAMHL